MISKNVTYKTKTQMELGISIMTADGWNVETTEFLPEKKMPFLEWILTIGRISRTVPEYYLVIYTREIDSQVKGRKGIKYAIPRWILYGVLTATASLITIGFLSISDDNWVGIWGFGFMVPAVLMDFFFLQLSSNNPQTELYYILMPAAIWFGIGSVIGKIMDLPRFDSVPEKHKNIFSVMLLIGTIVIGFFASFIMAGGYSNHN